VGANVAIYAVGNNNVYLGFENAANAVGSNNVFVGREAGKFAEVNDSIIIGDRAGQYAVGSNVVIIGGGGSGGNTSPTGNGSTILGSGAGANATGDFATDIGYDAGRNWVGDRVTFLGASAGSARGVGDDAVGVGAGSLDGGALGNSFTSVGSNSGYAAVGDDCVFVGSGAGASSDGDRNVAIGLDVLSGTTGSNNVVVGTGVTTSSLQSSVVVGKDLNLSGAASEIVVIGSNVSTASAPYTGGVYLGSDFAVSNDDNESLVVAVRGQRVISANSTHTVVGNASDPYFSANSKGDIAVGTSTNPTLRSNTKYIGIGSPSDPYFYATSLGDARVGQVGSTALFANTTSFQLGPGATIMNVTTTGAEMGYPYTLFANPTFTNGNSATDSYGTWTCTSNTTAANASTYYAFDGDSGTFYNSEVHTYSSSGSSWSPEIPTTQGTLATISGLWIQLEIPTERHIAFIRVVDSTDGTYLLYGSNDGATFSYVSSVTDDKSFGDPSQTTSYKYYRLIDAAPLSPSDGETFEMKIYEIVMSFWDETTGSDYFSANAIDGTVQLGPSGTTVYATPSVMMLGGTTAPYLTANAAGDFLVGRGSNAVTISKGSIYTFTGEVVAGGPSVGRYANFRVYHPYRSTIFISDSLNFSLVYTANGDPLGKYTDARPFMVNYNTGSVTVGTPLVVSNALQLYNDADIVLSSRGDGSKEDEFININGNLYAIGWRPGNSINFSIPDADNRWFLWRKKNSSYKASNIMTLASNGNLTTAGDIFMGGDTLSIRQSGYDIYSIVNSSKLSFSTRGGFYWGNSTGEDFLYINSAGELQLYGNIARKQTAGAWFGPSDMHLKTGIETANVEICYDTVKSLSRLDTGVRWRTGPQSPRLDRTRGPRSFAENHRR
jgi:hypothetical protein